MECARCGAGPAGADLFDWCALCGAKLCDLCAASGCCGQTPMMSGRAAAEASSKNEAGSGIGGRRRRETGTSKPKR